MPGEPRKMSLEDPPSPPQEPAPQAALPETPPVSLSAPRGKLAGRAIRLFTHPIARAVLYVGAFIAVQVLVSSLLRGLAFLGNGRIFRENGLASAPELLLVWVALQAPLALGLTYLFVRFFDRHALGSVGLRWPAGGRRAAGRQLAVTPLATLALIGTWVGLVLILPDRLAALRFGGVSEDFWRGRAWWPLPPGMLLLLLLLLFLIQGGVEELVTRGYLYHVLRERWRPWVAALASSILFALFHLFNPDSSALALVNILLAGMVLAGLVERTGSLWSATLAHGVWNFALSCLLSLPVSGFRIFHLLNVSATGDKRLTGGGFGPEGSLLLTLVGVPLALALWRSAGRSRPPRSVEDTPPSAPEDTPPGAPLEEPMVHTLQEMSKQPDSALSGGISP
jgi:membrane protease YdiL (CAAX protease family)